MSARQFRTAAIPTLILLAGGALLVLQLSGGGGRLRAANSSLPPTDPDMMTRVIATDPPVELVDERDDHTRVWEIVREVETTHPDGSTSVDTVKSYIHEKASGLCYKDASGSYVPAVAEWRERPDGFVIDRCSYGLSVGRTLGSWVTYTVEGRRAFFRPSCLMASDGVTEVSLAIVNAEVEGFIPLESPSTVRFPDALGDGIHLELAAEKDGFHQNLILTEAIELPEALDGEATRIYLYTETDLGEYAADPSYSLKIGESREDLSSETLVTEPSQTEDIVFTRAVRGPGGEQKEAPVWWFGESCVFDSSGLNQIEAARQLVRAYSGGQTYLVESIPQSFLEGAAFPVVLDAQPKSGAITAPETFDPRYTYWITGDLNVSSTLTILPGTTVKVNPGKSIHTLPPGGKIVAQGEPYNYITFTKASDGSCGEGLVGALPGNAYYLIHLGSGTSGSVVQYCKMAWAFRGVYVSSNASVLKAVANNVIMHGGTGIHTYSNVVCQNNLLVDCSYGIYSYGSFAPTLTNNTADDCYRGIHVYTGYASGGDIAYNLLSHCTYGIFCAMYSYPTLHNNALHDNVVDFHSLEGILPGEDNEEIESEPYASSCPLGDFFLDEDNPEVMAELIDRGPYLADPNGLGNGTFTVFPPTCIEAGEYTGSDTWGKIDIEVPDSYLDIGYHHCRVDRYIAADCTFSGTGVTLTLEPGLAVGIDPAGYLAVDGGAKLASVGHPLVHGYNVFTNSKSLSMHIESPLFEFGENPSAGTNPYISLGANANGASRLEFTKTSWLGEGLKVDCELDQPIGGSVFCLSTYGLQIVEGNVLFNNLVHHNCQGADTSGGVQVLHSTFDMNQTGVKAQPGSEQETHIRDCLFSKHDSEGISISGAGDVYHYYNAFWENNEDVSGGSGSPGNGSEVLDELPYEDWTPTDWHDRYRLVASFKDNGSVKAADAGLGAYTTSRYVTYDTRHVDWGFHFLARPTIWVDARVPPDQDASGTPLDPCGTIHHPEFGALAKASAGTTIVVLPGTYLYHSNEGEDQEQLVAISSVHVIGSGARTTVLDAQRIRNPTSNPFVSWPLLKIESRSNVTIAALTITGRFNEEWAEAEPGPPLVPHDGGMGGGAICKDSTGIVIRDCLVSYNDADYGGGLYIKNSNVTIEDCIIHQNKAISGIAGGGIYITSCSSPKRRITITRCVISNNSAGAPDEDLGLGGGGIFCTSNSDPVIEDCLFLYNRAAWRHGGGIFLDTGCDATILNSVVEHNIARQNIYKKPDPSSPGCGGGIYMQNCSPEISGCTIANNGSIMRGAGISCFGPSCRPAIVNCTAVYNKGLQPEQHPTAGIWSDGAQPTIVNCIIWGNGDDLAGGTYGMATYSCVENEGDENEGEGNIHTHPLLVGSINGPYHLGHGSVCIGAGTTDPAKLPPDYEFPEVDIDGDDRVIAEIDMGSDERHPFREMVGIERDYVNGTIIITWKTDNGKSYGVYSSDDPFTNYMSWDHREDVPGNGGLVSWQDGDISFGAHLKAYYKVLERDEEEGTWTRPVGFVDAQVENIDQGSGYESSFFAIPLEPMYETINASEGDYNENLARMIAGHAQLPTERLWDGDEIKFLRLGYPDTSSEDNEFVQLELQWDGAQPKWYTTGENPTESHHRFSPGQVFRILPASGSRARITLVGHVPCRPAGFLPFRALYDWYSVEFGYPYPVHTTLNDIPFLDHGAIGEPDNDPHTPDLVYIYTAVPPDESPLQELWLKNDAQEHGMWYHGTTQAGSPLYDVFPGKGFRYFGRQQDPECGEPPSCGYIWNNIYWRRVPVPRPYRTQ